MLRKSLLTLAMIANLGLAASGTVKTSNHPSLWNTLAELKSQEFVDLTHAFHPDIPHWPGFDPEVRTTIYHYDDMIGSKGSGFLAHRYSIPGQWGTHVDPPAHFIKGKRFQDEISVKEMVLPLVVFDVSNKVAQNPDYQIKMEDVRAWEKKYGQVPEGAFAAMRTDWHKRWPSMTKMRNEDSQGIAHYPGWSAEVLKYLYEERKITASGHETTDTDPGISTSRDDYSLEAYILAQDKYQIELLSNLDQVPEYGAIAIVTFPKPLKGSGFPARVFAILP
ncbi:MAG: cyclase family protein [Symploca sp. SIO1B1]|nr:cyclase family protein [Symploca sp. SIO1B1]